MPTEVRNPSNRAATKGSRCILYTAAHGGFLKENVPLGGGAAVFEHLLEEWQRTKPFPIQALTPALLGDHAPTGRDVVHFGESAYAKFSRDFERATTAEILKHDPQEVVVLVNDVSEGPDFDQLATRGYRIYTIYHVDVVAYVASVYFRERILPETTVRWYRKLRWLMPDMAGLVWAKQEASVRSSQGLIVPSAGMRDVLLRCYPDCPPSKIHVLPWGMWSTAEQTSINPTIDLRNEFNIPSNAHILLTLSRISPEKGQDLLLEALLDWEQRPDYPATPLYVFICGDAAFMQGIRFMEKLRSLASRLKRTKVIFPGYVTGARKQAFFAAADLYIFPSRHESYGLTLLEALASGLPAVCLDTAGARSVMKPEFGALVQNRDQLHAAIARLLSDPQARKRMGEAAHVFAKNERFSDRAAQLASLLVSPT